MLTTNVMYCNDTVFDDGIMSLLKMNILGYGSWVKPVMPHPYDHDTSKLIVGIQKFDPQAETLGIN